MSDIAVALVKLSLYLELGQR